MIYECGLCSMRLRCVDDKESVTVVSVMAVRVPGNKKMVALTSGEKNSFYPLPLDDDNSLC